MEINSDLFCQSGSNDNGNWIKFADGTLIQYGIRDKSHYQTIEDYSSKVQGLIFYRSNLDTITFPLSFVDSNYTIQATPKTDTQGSRSYFVRYTENYATSIQLQLINLDGLFSSDTALGYKYLIEVSWLAIGRWK